MPAIRQQMHSGRAGEIGYRFAGLVLLCAAITSIIGAAYTSVSFLKTFSKGIEKNENWVIIGFIAVSTLIMLILEIRRYFWFWPEHSMD